MERRVTCPKCQNQMTVNLWSETLSQLLKCSSCSNKFTYDPGKDIPRTEEEKSPGMIEKGLKGAISAATSPLKTATKGITRVLDSVNGVESALKGVEGPTAGGLPGGKNRPGTGGLVGSKGVACPFCRMGFQAGLPDNDKPVLTTRCPRCSKIFTFTRPTPAELQKNQKVSPPDAPGVSPQTRPSSDQIPPQPPSLQPQQEQLPERPPEPHAIPVAGESLHKKEPAPATGPAPLPDSQMMDEDFAIPLAMKDKIEPATAQPDVPIESRVEPVQPPEIISKAPMALEDWETLETLPKEGEEKKGIMLDVSCPYCYETFNTPAPSRKKKVSCPFCEGDFHINSRGDYIARKAGSGVGGFLSRFLGFDPIETGRSAFNEAIHGMKVIKDPESRNTRLKARSGTAAVLLAMVAILGLLYCAFLVISIPDMGEDDASGNVSVSGGVICDMDTCEGAEVRIIDMDLETTTNSGGTFLFYDIPAGDHTLEVTASGKGTIRVHFTIDQSDVKKGNKDVPNINLPNSGSRTEDRRDSREESAGLMIGLMTLFVLLVSLLSLMGASLALQGKRFHLTLFISLLAITSFGFGLGSLLALTATVFVLAGRKNFES